MRSIVSITVPATATALTTLAAVREELGLSDQEDNALVQRMIARASVSVVGFLGRPLARETVVETFRDVLDLPMLRLSRYPVVSIASVVVDGLTLAGADYELAGERQQLHRLVSDDVVDWTARKIVVTYTGGYLLPGQQGANLPGDIEAACLIAIVADYQSRGRDPQLRSETADGIGGQSWLDPDTAAHGALPWAAAERLQPYRRHDK